MNKCSIGKKIIIIVSLLIVFSTLLTTASLAWFVFYKYEMNSAAVGGKLLTNYFNSGTGKEDDPFIITRPIHYYNLVNLYQRVPDYSDNRYYFQLGTTLKEKDGDTGIYVYNYDDDGNVIKSDPYSKVLNLAYYSGENALLPIGTHDKNFLGHFLGNGLTISNITVSTLEEQKDCDIGIFGYVGQNADIRDVYFSNVTIDLSNVRSTEAVINLKSEGQTHNKDVHSINGHNVAYVGYVAGHVITNSQFNDVYINNVNIVGGGSGTSATSGFGYFGCIENTDGTLVDTLGASIGEMTSSGVDISEIYERLSGYRSSADEIPFTVSKSVWVNGSVTEEFDVISTSAIRQNDTGSSKGSFAFSKESQSSEGNTVYLTGKSDVTQTVTTLTVTPQSDGFYLTSQTGKTYLTLNEEKNGLTTTDTKASATVWACDSDGYYFTTEIDDESHSCVYYYINAVGNDSACSAEVSTTRATQWTYDSSKQLYCTVGGKTWYLAFSGENLGSAGGSTKNIIQSEYGGATYYLTVTGTNNTIGHTTTESEATEFEKEGNYWKVKGTAASYLSYSDSEVKISNTAMTAIYVNNFWVLGLDQEVYFSEKKWKTRAVRSLTDYYLYTTNSGNNFLDISNGVLSNNVQKGGTSGNVNVPTGTVVWTLPAYNTTGYITTEKNGIKYYLVGTPKGKRSSNKYIYGDVSVTTSEDDASLWFRGASYIGLQDKGKDETYYSKQSKISYGGIQAFCYLQYSNKSDNNNEPYKWRIDSYSTSPKKTLPLNAGSGGSGSAGENGNLTTTAGTISKLNDPTSVYQTVVTVISETTVSHPSIDTWFPILANEDGTPNTDNIGYVIGGMSYSTPDYYQAGDVRVTASGINSISGSYSGGGFTNIYTVNGMGKVNASGVTDFTAYSSAKDSFGRLLNGKTNIYGIHFMDSAVSAADTVTVSEAAVGGNEYEGLVLPRHCVDVSVKKSGCINLFAGNYYSGNTGFFSLYHVIRDEDNTITDVKKISKIYKVGASKYYVYEGDSSPYNEADLVFDSAWMSQAVTTGNELFYFEIPVEVGEYAIGSADGNNGAYLLYLDVAGAEEQGTGNGLTENNFKVDVRSSGYKNSSDYVEHSLLQFEINAPGVSADDFSVKLEFTDDSLPEEYSKGLYKITVTNKTGVPIGITVYLCDDDGVPGNTYSYAYQVFYTNGSVTNATVMNGARTYFQSCSELTIP